MAGQWEHMLRPCLGTSEASPPDMQFICISECCAWDSPHNQKRRGSCISWSQGDALPRYSICLWDLWGRGLAARGRGLLICLPVYKLESMGRWMQEKEYSQGRKSPGSHVQNPSENSFWKCTSLLGLGKLWIYLKTEIASQILILCWRTATVAGHQMFDILPVFGVPAR